MESLEWRRIPDIFKRTGASTSRLHNVIDFLKNSHGAKVTAEGSTGITASIQRGDLFISHGSTLPENSYVILTATRGTEKPAKTRVYIDDYSNVLLADPPPDLVQSTVTVDAPEPKVQSTITVAAPAPKVQQTVTVDAPDPKVQQTVTVDAPDPKVQQTRTVDDPPVLVQQTRNG